MKKFILGMCMVAALGTSATSCNGSGSKADADNDTLVAVATSDSISEFFGRMAGGYIGSELSYYAKQSGEDYSREEFLKGIQAVVNSDKEEAYIAGISTGLRVYQEIKELKKQGVQVDRSKLLKALSEGILADSISKDDLQKNADAYQALVQRVQAQNQAREEARKANSPEAKANEKAGAEYLKTVKGIQKTKSGLGYVIENAGEGENIKSGDRVKMNYVGKLINGNQFDKGEGATLEIGKGLISGFSEGLQLLKKGAKATLYIPGHLAYGVNGVPQANIGPNEMLIFEIEVLDIENTPAPADNGTIQ